MRVLSIFYFVTFVLSSSLVLAASTPKTTLETSPFEATTDDYLNTIPREDFAPRKYFEATFALGYAGGNYLEEYSWPQGTDFSIRLDTLNPQEESRFFSEVALTQKDFYSIGLGKKFNINETDVYEPYALLSVNAYSEYDESLKGLFKLNRWRLRAAAGIGKVINTEIGTGLSINGPDLYIRVGLKQKF